MLRRLLPAIHWTEYGRIGEDGTEEGRYLTIWRQWGRRAWNITEVRVG